MSPAIPDPDRSADRADEPHPPPDARVPTVPGDPTVPAGDGTPATPTDGYPVPADSAVPTTPPGVSPPATPPAAFPPGAFPHGTRPGPFPAGGVPTGGLPPGTPPGGFPSAMPTGEATGPADLLAPPTGETAGEPILPVRRRLALATGVVLALTAAGALLGLLWAALAPGTPVIRTADGAVYAEAQPEQPIAADGWFSLLGLGFGVLAALALWFLLRRQRGPLGLLAAVLGCLGAAVVAWRLGRQIGLSTYERLLVTAPVGEGFDKPVDLRAGGVDLLFGVLPVPYGDLLLPAFAAAVTYTLLAGWSRWPSLRPEPVEVSWVPAGTPVPAAAPEPPGPDAAEPTRG